MFSLLCHYHYHCHCHCTSSIPTTRVMASYSSTAGVVGSLGFSLSIRGSPRRALSIRGQSNKPKSKSNMLSGQSLDEMTKVELSRSDIERHAEETLSEKRSVMGSKPASTKPWPRSEIERRPETGDRSLMALFAFDGAAPETINGRMAMVGFVWALMVEQRSGLRVVEQLHDSGLLYFGLVVQIFTLASVIPFVNGESTDARRWGPFTAKAERWNGRLAMLGFAALLLVESITRVPLLH